MNHFPIRIVRSPSEVVLEASSSTWQSLRETAHSELPGQKHLRIALHDGGVHHSTEFPELSFLVFELRPGLIDYKIEGNELQVLGPQEQLDALFENIDSPNPTEGTHHHSGPFLPWVEESAVEVVFMHRVFKDAL